MSTLVESLKRLYGGVKVTIEKVDMLLAEGSILQEEYDYIVA